MRTLKAQVKGGRFIIDDPADDYPEGAEVELYIDDYKLNSEEEAVLDDACDESMADYHAGKAISAERFIAELKALK